MPVEPSTSLRMNLERSSGTKVVSGALVRLMRIDTSLFRKKTSCSKARVLTCHRPLRTVSLTEKLPTVSHPCLHTLGSRGIYVVGILGVDESTHEAETSKVPGKVPELA